MRSQIKRFVHSFCIGMVPTALAAYGGVLGIAAAAASTNTTASTFLDSQIAMLVAMTGAEHFAAWLVGLVLLWLAAFIWSMERREPYGTIESKLPPVSGAINAAEQQDTCSATGTVNAALDGVSLTATGTTSLHGLYVGNIIASAASLHDMHRLELAIIGFNGASEAILVSGVSGHIKVGDGNLRDMVALETPTMRSSAITAPGGEIILVLVQALTSTEAGQFLTALETKRLQLDLRSLHITVASVSDISRSTRLPLWDAVALRRRDDIVSNRVTIMGIQAAAEVKVSLGMVVARVDGATEHRDA